MKLNLIKIASILMVLSMVFALAIPAFAEGEATEEITAYEVIFHAGPRANIMSVNAGDALGATLFYGGMGVSTVEGDGIDVDPEKARVLQGWSTTHVDGKGTSEGLVDENTIVNANMDLYPVYSYVVTFHIGARDPMTVPVYENETLWVLENYAHRVAPETDDQGRELQGWFCNGKEVDYTVPVTENMDVYAKYVATLHIGDKVVNKKMLDVKYQLNKTETENTTDIRFVTSIDDLDYKSVSFKLTFTTPLDGTEVYTLTTNKAYTALAGEDKTPAQAFVSDSNYFVAYTITDMPTDFYKAITVQAILTLNDGTTVEGNVCPVAFN